MSWGPDGITFVGSVPGTAPSQDEVAILRVSPTGGQPEVLVRAANDEYPTGRPQVINGEVVLFSRENRKDFGKVGWEDNAQIVAHSIRSGKRHVLLTGGSDPHYLPTGHLVYASGGRSMPSV